MTPTLSVAAFHATVTLDGVTALALSSVGALGAVRSAAVPPVPPAQAFVFAFTPVRVTALPFGPSIATSSLYCLLHARAVKRYRVAFVLAFGTPFRSTMKVGFAVTLRAASQRLATAETRQVRVIEVRFLATTLSAVAP